MRQNCNIFGKKETKCKNIKDHVGKYVLWKAVTAQTLKAYGEIRVQFQPFLASALVGNRF